VGPEAAVEPDAQGAEGAADALGLLRAFEPANSCLISVPAGRTKRFLKARAKVAESSKPTRKAEKMRWKW
jgi:hypothetical protein